jgi:DNA-binding beta-propeller fold protein YncE
LCSPLLSGGGQFQLPHCITVDSAGNIYAADSGNDRIQKFAP